MHFATPAHFSATGGPGVNKKDMHCATLHKCTKEVQHVRSRVNILLSLVYYILYFKHC